MEISEKLIKFYNNLSKIEKTNLIKKYSINLHKINNQMTKALDSELKYGFERRGLRGGKFTSINAKSSNLSKSFFVCEIELKFMINNI